MFSSKYLSNSYWLFLEKVFSLLLSFLVGIWVARYLGPEDFGLMKYAQSLVGIILVLSNLGLSSILVKEIVLGKWSHGKVLMTSFLMKLSFSFFSYLTILLYFRMTSNEPLQNWLIYIFAGVLIFNSFNVIDGYFQSQEKNKYAVFSRIIASFSTNCLKIYFILNNQNVVFIGLCFLLESIITSISYLYFFSRKTPISFSELIPVKKLSYFLINEAWPLILSGFMISLYMKIDQLMIKNILGNSMVGQYAAAVRLSELWFFIPSTIAIIVFPKLVRLREENKDYYYSLLQKIYSLVIWIALLISIAVFLLSDWIVDLLYGSQYVFTSGAVKIHVWSSILVFIGTIYSRALTVEGKIRINAYKAILGAVFNITFNFILIPIYGIKGAAFATLISLLVSTFLIDILFKELWIHLKMKIMGLIEIKSVFIVFKAIFKAN